MTQQRQMKWIEYMHAAKRNPEIYSRCVSLPAQGKNLMGNKIEVRISIDLDPEDDEDTTTTVKSYLHCFEGTVTEVNENPKSTKRTVHGVSTKHSVAAIKWDIEFVQWGETTYHVLDPELYGKEDKNGGWNILNQEYLDAADCREDQFSELQEQWSTRDSSDSMDLS